MHIAAIALRWAKVVKELMDSDREAENFLTNRRRQKVYQK